MSPCHCHVLAAGKTEFAGAPDAEKPRLMRADGVQAEHRYDVVSRSNKFRKPVSLPPTPWDDERNAIDHHPSPSNLKTALAWFAH
jgi:hypothetical protein